MISNGFSIYCDDEHSSAPLNNNNCNNKMKSNGFSIFCDDERSSAPLIDNNCNSNSRIKIATRLKENLYCIDW